MPNALTATGLTTATQAELLAELTASLQTIYGASINLASDTPDGQWLNIIIQMILDLEDLIMQVYNSMDPDNAIGVVLDQRVAINGIQRQAGTFTVTNITLVNTQSVTLYGLDQTANTVYTISDNQGNQYQLQATQSGLSGGSHTLAFQAAAPGALTPTENTITVPVTIVLGVQSVNNPTGATTVGINEESDAALRIRRQQSVSFASQGYLAGLLAALENINGVTSAFVYENDTDTTDANNVPSHSIWVIVAGSGSDANIGQAIYDKRNAGCGMKGSSSTSIMQVNGLPFVVKWDAVTTETLWIEFNATALNSSIPPNTAAILAQLPLLFVPGVYQEVNINQLATFIQQIDPNTLVTGAGFSTAQFGSYTNTLTPTAQNYQFVFASANITITVL